MNTETVYFYKQRDTEEIVVSQTHQKVERQVANRKSDLFLDRIFCPQLDALKGNVPTATPYKNRCSARNREKTSERTYWSPAPSSRCLPSVNVKNVKNAKLPLPLP